MSSAAPPRSVVTMLAVGAGLAAASLYYNQPMLAALARDLGATPSLIGLVPTLTQLGYATGILAFAPLGDRLDRRRVILVKCVALAAVLAVAALAPNAPVMIAASFALGLAATTAQDLVPAAAAIAPAESRGRVVGMVMTGLLLGILLSRVVSGAVSQYASWRAVFGGAAGAVVLLFALLAWRLPSFPPATDRSYVALLASIGALVRDLAPLRRAALAQALLSFAFSGFWSTLALGLDAAPFHLSSTVAGAFGIAGAAGALAAPLAGAASDKRGPESVARAGALVCLASFGAMAALAESLVALAVGTVAFDAGAQSSLIAHQTIIYAQDPAARSRLNAVLVSGMFVGMASGAFTASRVFAAWGLRGVLVLCAGASGVALLVRRR
ncbi:MAG: MFS transporter [Labilithrix sp.]|nr:MFS transporter [Labilithrix sp.]MCW5815849.1 MFS transporter [Labilithrix sp.]